MSVIFGVHCVKSVQISFHKSFLKFFVLELITLPAGSDWSPVEFSIVRRIFFNVAITCLTKLITVIKSVFSCWPLFVTQAVFTFFEIAYDRFAIGCVVSDFVGCSFAICRCLYSLLDLLSVDFHVCFVCSCCQHCSFYLFCL